jgi:acyl-CoA thioesterase-2
MTVTTENCAGDVDLADCLTVERLDERTYRSVYVADAPSLFGGQLLGQGVLACGGTVAEERIPHSLHAYFLRAGDPRTPVTYRVSNDRDGRSFSARRVTAFQHGAPVFTMAMSFDSGVPIDAVDEHRMDNVMVLSPLCQEFRTPLPLEVRSDDWDPSERAPMRFLVRPRGFQASSDPMHHAAAIAFMSDFSAGLRRDRPGYGVGPSLDHALWFHTEAQWNDWLYVELVPGHARGHRGWYRGSVADRDGRIVASLTQEMLYRRSGPAADTRNVTGH